jgi:DNA-binding FadR family transcriptional regulator
MEWVGLVGRVEQDLERTISQGLLPKDGFLPSEHSLAKYYGVSRTTVREAIRRLAARDLVVQHPGRRSRAVALDEAVTLENLSVVLNGEGPIPPERLRLLEGFLALKRDTAVELLVACCEHASARHLDKLQALSFALMDSASWEPAPGRWVAMEFDLLRLAAQVTNRPGQALLLQSLERSYRAMAGHLLPHVDASSIRRWALCAFHALGEKDIPKLRQELPGLLQAGDEHLLRRLVPSHEPVETPMPSSAADPSPLCRRTEPGPPASGDDASTHPPVQGGETEPDSPNLSSCWTGLSAAQPTGPLPSASPGPGLNPAPGATALQEPMLHGELASRGEFPGLCKPWTHVPEPDDPAS